MSENQTGEIVIYQTDDGQTKIDVRFEDETVWLTQAQLVDLYQSSKANISEHIKHIFEGGELDEDSAVRNFRTTAADGKSYNTKFYNLDMIISLGYRVKSIIATRFRRWATEQLKETGGGNYESVNCTVSHSKLQNLAIGKPGAGCPTDDTVCSALLSGAKIFIKSIFLDNQGVIFKIFGNS